MLEEVGNKAVMRGGMTALAGSGILAIASSLAGDTDLKDFMRIWEEVSSTSSRLRGQSLQSIMIRPIQRIPRYVLLLQELDKRLSVDHPAKAHLKNALTQISLVATSINEALRRHEKLSKLVGDMPEISGAQLSNKGGGAARLTVNYAVKRR